MCGGVRGAIDLTSSIMHDTGVAKIYAQEIIRGQTKPNVGSIIEISEPQDSTLATPETLASEGPFLELEMYTGQGECTMD